ncbi:hypothetical protein [Gorillibacterium sp. CAU 1737]|uniref:hypothetical protein n=1 Tax=Gorillibacterium sp. CAU 1737 TaxID=3140362 RepID=UPI0032609B66
MEERKLNWHKERAGADKSSFRLRLEAEESEPEPGDRLRRRIRWMLWLATALAAILGAYGLRWME